MNEDAKALLGALREGIAAERARQAAEGECRKAKAAAEKVATQAIGAAASNYACPLPAEGDALARILADPLPSPSVPRVRDRGTIPEWHAWAVSEAAASRIWTETYAANAARYRRAADALAALLAP